MDKQIKLDSENKNFKVMAVTGMVKGEDGTESNTPVIVAGDITENGTWNNPHDVTTEAIEAVRDYLFASLDKNPRVGFKWSANDSKQEIRLVLEVVNNETEEVSDAQ